ncbi:MAG: hypothetical protein MN733_21125 [Nitrososphaera sp.]|nr:hypothetical protein [Nitrososphaera sp.]
MGSWLDFSLFRIDLIKLNPKYAKVMSTAIPIINIISIGIASGDIIIGLRPKGKWLSPKVMKKTSYTNRFVSPSRLDQAIGPGGRTTG